MFKRFCLLMLVVAPGFLLPQKQAFLWQRIRRIRAFLRASRAKDLTASSTGSFAHTFPCSSTQTLAPEDINNTGWNSSRSDKIVFVKTAATGSSTLTGILHRFCDIYDKNCFVQCTGGPVYMPADIKHFVGQDLKLNVWPNHILHYDTHLFEKLIPGSFKFSIFREPLSRILSTFKHKDIPHRPLDAMEKLQANETYNGYHGSSYATLQTPHKAMSDFMPISALDELDLVLLTEQYDRSLMMLGRRLHWPMQDLLYLRLKSSHSKELDENVEKLGQYLRNPGSEPNAATKSFLDQWVFGKEGALYSRAKTIFEQQWQNYTQEERESIDADVSVFQQALGKLGACCELDPTDAYCRYLNLDNMDWNAVHKGPFSNQLIKFQYLVQSDCRKVAESALEGA